jgi:hypothetical protein
MPALIDVLAVNGCGFDCASAAEIQLALDAGVSPERIIFAHPAKRPYAIPFAILIGLIACLARPNDRNDMIACLIRLIASLIPTCDRTTSPTPRPRALIATDDLPLHASAHRSASAWQVRHPFRRVQGCANDHVRLHPSG